MIQKRSNPFEETNPEINGQEEAKIQKRINPLTLEAIEAPKPEPVQAQPEQVAHTPVLAQEKRPTAIEGKAKRKRVFTKVNKDLLIELYNATGKKAGELLDSALLCLAYCEYPKAYLRAKNALEQKGCEIV